MALNETYRGLTDGIILYVLKSGDRHTDELKQIIDDLFFDVKLGTLYSVINRLKSQNYINEYRMSNIDGSRRKYYALTVKGLDKFNADFAERFQGAPPIKSREVPVEIVQAKASTATDKKPQEAKKPAEPKKEEKVKIEKSYVDYLNGDYTFTTNDDVLNVGAKNTYNYSDFDKNATAVKSNGGSADNGGYAAMFTPAKPEELYGEREIDFDSVSDTGKEYKTLLENLYPKAKNEKGRPSEEFLNQTQSAEPQFNYDDVYLLAEKEGVKIKTANDTNRYQGTKTLLNLLNMHVSLIWIALLFAELMIFNLIFVAGVGFNFLTTLKITLIAAVVPLVFTIVYFADKTYAIKNPPKFKDVLEIALIISISAIIIAIAVAAIVQIDYTSVKDVYNHILLPCLISLNVPIFFVIAYVLMKKEYYQTV